MRIITTLRAIPLLCLPSAVFAASDEDHFRDRGAGYIAAVHQSLHARWKTFTDMLQTMPPGTRIRDDKGLAVTLELKVWPDGTVVRVEKTSTSGLDGFDSAPSDLLRDVPRLPPPPPALRSDDGQVYLRWRFDRAGEDGDRGAVIERRLPIDEAVERLVGAGSADRAAARVDEETTAHPERGAELLWLLARAVARHDVEATDPARRAAAARALAVLDDNEGPLLRLARDPEAGVRAAALVSIGRGDPSRALVGALLAALDTDDAGVAARALDRLCSPGAHAGACRDEARGELRAALRRTLRAARAPIETIEALRTLGDEAGALAATEALLASAATRPAGARAALQLAAAALEPAVVAAVTGSAVADRAILVEALGAIGRRLGAPGRAALLRAVADAEPGVRAAAARALGLTGERKAKSRLIDALVDDDAAVRAAATTSLVAVAGEEAADELFRPLRDPSPSVRAALAAALVAHPVDSAAPLLRRLRTDSEPAVQAAARGPAPSPAPATPAADDSDVRLLRATNDAERTRAAADWLSAHVQHPPATVSSAGRRAVNVLAVIE